MQQRRMERALLAAALAAFAWFHAGGGWNQNARFAMVRSLVEQGRSAIDDYLVYARVPGDEHRLVRAPVRDGRLTLGGRPLALAWRDAGGRFLPLEGAGGGAPPAGVAQVEPAQVACTGDLAFHAGHFHPNKAPGTTWAAVPAYLLVHGATLLAGLDPDDWRVLTAAAWLTSALSVGLLAALGCVLLFRLALRLSGGDARASLLAAAALAFGTMYLGYATALYEHDLIAVALLAAFALLHGLRRPGPAGPDARQVRLRLALAGASAGFAAVCNYAMAVPVAMLGAYLWLAVPRRGAWRWYALGVLVPFLALSAYQAAAFGSPFATNYQHQNPFFLESSGALLGVFLPPQPGALAAILFSPFRGLFYGSPVLLLAAPGLLAWLRDPERRAEAWLVLALLGFFLLLVSTFNGWHGGWAAGPRYLVPVLPFLCLPLAHAFARLPRAAGALLALSVAIQVVVTAVDIQAPVGVGPSTTLRQRPTWRHDPLLDYDLPIFLTGRAGPFLRALEAEQGPGTTFLAAVQGPVSANAVGIYEGAVFQLFPPGSASARWSAFNAGELVFPGSRWSLAPLVAWVGGLAAWALRRRA